MKKKNKRALNRCAVAMLSASMIAPNIAPVIPAFATESVRDSIRSINFATASDAKEDDKAGKNEDVLIEDGDILPDEDLKATPSDAEEVEGELDGEILPDGTVLGEEQKVSKYETFGTTAFWEWFNGLVTDASELEEDEDVAEETLREQIAEWYDSIMEEEKATDSDADKDYPAFDDTFDVENSPFWIWFYENAVILDSDGNVTGYNNSVIFDWIRNSSFEDVFDFLLTFNNLRQTMTLASTIGDIWPAEYGARGDLYNYENGSGTEESPYIIDSVDDLRLLAITIASGEQKYNTNDTYYLIKKGTYDLNGTWIPIGFQKVAGNEANAFMAHIAAEDGANIKNIGFNASGTLGVTAEMANKIEDQEAVGFFGEVGAGATITNLYLNTSGNTLEGKEYAGILAGHAVDATIKECTVVGRVKGYGYVGGIVGYAESSQTEASDRNMIIEDCSAEKASVYTTEAVEYAADFCNGHSCVGGIVGYAANTTILDSYVSTNTGAGNHIYGNGAYTGGIVGVIENSDVFNSYVYDGEIGETNGYATGGIVGGYDGGSIKVARFSGSVTRPTSTNNYSACFLGTRVNGAGFTYGEEGDVAYLFADSKEKADTGICGARVEDDGVFGQEAHIGYWHSSDNYYTIVSGGNTNGSDDYFYKELERGSLNVKKTGENVETINHYTADKQGRPTRGYLLTINDPMVDTTVAAKISAYISGSYKPVVTSEELGAFAPGDIVYISFQDMSDGTGYFQMIDKTGNPYYNYYKADNFNAYKEKPTQEAVTKGAGYYIKMPESDVTVGADYKKVSQSITTNPSKVVFEITQVRTGSRENPTIEWYATAYNGNKDVNTGAQVITDVNGNRWEGTNGTPGLKLATILPDGTTEYNKDAIFYIGSLVNGSNNDKFNLIWQTSNDGDNRIVSNPVVEQKLTNGAKAYVTLNVEDSALAEKVNELVEAQKAGGYKDSITTSQPYWYHSLVTATAQPDDSEDKANPPKGYTDIDFKLNVIDNTNVSIEGVYLSKNEINYNVVRTLTGDRKNPTVSYTINGKAADGTEITSSLNANFNPDYFSNESVSWYLSSVAGKDVAVDADKAIIDDGTITVAKSGEGDKAYYNATVTLKGIKRDSCSENAIINNVVEGQDKTYTSQLKKVPDAETTYTKYVKVTANDPNNNSKTDTCTVNVTFKTVDQTEIMPESVVIDGKVSTTGDSVKGAENINGYNIYYTFAGDSSTDIATRTIRLADTKNTLISNGKGETITAKATPEVGTEEEGYTPYNKDIIWSLVNADPNSNLNPYDVLNIDPSTGQITVRGYAETDDTSSDAYSPWIQSLIDSGNLEGNTAKIRIIATSVRDNSKIASKDIDVNFTANTIASNVEDSLSFDVVLTKETATSLADTDITAKESWTGTDAQTISATATGTSETPIFTVYKDGKVDTSVLNLRDSLSRMVSANKYVSVKTDADWIKNVINGRANGNSGTENVTIKTKTSHGDSVTEIPVVVNFRYDGTDMTAKTVSALPDGYTASPDVITSDTAAETYDTKKASVKDRQITMDVVATQGNYSVNNPGTRKWSYGIVKLDNTTYTSAGVASDATYELSGDIKDYCKVDADGYLVPIKGNWDDLISAGEVKGSVSGVVTAKKEADGKVMTDSYKVAINFRYDKAVLESHEESFDVVYTQDSQTNSTKSHWAGDNYIQLKAHISDESGKDVTPVWESSDESIATVDADGRVSVNKETWIKQIIDDAQIYGNDVHSGTKTVTVTAKHPVTGATADTCQITVNFRYDQVIMDSHEEVYDLVMTQTSRTNNPSVSWSGNDIRKLDSKVFVAPGLNNNPKWASEDKGIVTVDEAGNIAPIINADWQLAIVNEGKFGGQKKVAVNATNDSESIKDSCNVILNFQYENVVMSENAKTMDITLTASGSRSNPTYTITGNTAAISAILNSVREGEEKVVYTSSNSGLIRVDENGNLSLVLPESMTGTAFSGNVNAFIAEAMKHAYTTANPYVSSTDVVINAATEDGRMSDQCNLKVNMKYVNNTYSTGGGGGGGGGSSSGGGGGSSSSGVTPGGSVSALSSSLPSYVIKGGTWTQNAAGQWFYSNGRTFTDEWAAVQNPYADTSIGQAAYDWFHFGKDSVMTVGWYTDEAGDTYYLNPVSDNTKGHMFIGWQWIDDNGDGISECYYFEPQSNGFRGRLYKSTTTPDGYTVNEKGQWTENGVVRTRNANS